MKLRQARARQVLLLLAATALLCACGHGLPGTRAPKEPARPPRARARDLGLVVGVLDPGPLNAITDVAGVRVGHVTVSEGTDVRTGVTVILPHGDDLFQFKVPAAVSVGNGFGKAIGFTQVQELGEIESPIALTGTLNAFRVADALVSETLEREGNENVRSFNPIVGETNDGFLSDIRGRHVTEAHVREALRRAASGPVPEGSLGAGTGTRCLGFKGGIGTASRILDPSRGGYTVGVLVQTNFGGILSINGSPVGRELRRARPTEGSRRPGGSCMIVVATDAPLSPRNLERLASRTFLAFGRVGAYSANGSGDYAIAFSTHPDLRRGAAARRGVHSIPDLANASLSPLFLAAVEATEEAILNSLFMAASVTGRGGHTSQALPIEPTLTILERYGALHWDRRFSKGR